MLEHFSSGGFGVLLGEYGATIRTNLGTPALNAEYEGYRRYYMQYITRSMERHGLVPFYWDIGYYGNHGSGIFDRATGARVYLDIHEAILDTSKVGPVTGMRESLSRSTKFFLGQNYPNPFNPKTVVSSQLPEVSDVKLVVYDLLGREVALVVNERRAAGSYRDEIDGSGLASGVYVYRLTAGIYSESRKMLLCR